MKSSGTTSQPNWRSWATRSGTRRTSILVAMSDHQAWTFPREPRPPCSMPRVKQRTPPIASSGITADLIGNFSTPQLGLRTTWCHFRCHSPQTEHPTATTARSIRQWWRRRPRNGGNQSTIPVKAIPVLFLCPETTSSRNEPARH